MCKSGRSGDGVRLVGILAVATGVGSLFDPLVREVDDPARDADEGGREVGLAGLVNLLVGFERVEIVSTSVRDADEPARGRLCGLK